MIAIGIVIAPAFARVVRGAVLEVMGFPFVESSRALGASHGRIMVGHVFPNIAAPLIVLVTVYLSTAILSEAALSFLGLGTQPPEASWGGMLTAPARTSSIDPWLSIFPGLAIMIVVSASTSSATACGTSSTRASGRTSARAKKEVRRPCWTS